MRAAGCCYSRKLPLLPILATPAPASRRQVTNSGRRPRATLRSVRVIRDFALVVENHGGAPLTRIARPLRNPTIVGISAARELQPRATHFFGQRKFRRR